MDEIFWVLPDWTVEEEVKELFWIEGMKDIPGFWFNYDRGPNPLMVFVNVDGSFSYQKTEKKFVHKVMVSKSLVQDLQVDTKKVIYADIDLDYFGSTGYDTSGSANYNYTESELVEKLNAVFDALIDLEPEYISFSRSPGYAPSEDIVFIEMLIQEAMDLNE